MPKLPEAREGASADKRFILGRKRQLGFRANSRLGPIAKSAD
jgi:hypothetical protein